MRTLIRSVIFLAAAAFVSLPASDQGSGQIFTNRVRWGSTAGPEDFWGTGSPEGVHARPKGSTFRRTDGSSDCDAFYVKVSGSGNTGWKDRCAQSAGANGGAAGVHKRKASDESVTSSTTLQSDDDLNVAMLANEHWQLDWMLLVDAVTAGDIKLALNVPASATGAFSCAPRLQTGATTDTDTIATAGTTDLTDTGVLNIGGAGAGTPVTVRCSAYVRNSTNAGTVTLRWAQRVSDGTATKILTNSTVSASRTDAAPEALHHPTAAYAALPAAGFNGRVAFTTDSPFLLRDNGSAYVPWGPIYPLTLPVDPGTWVNQDGATITTTGGSLYLSKPAHSGVSAALRVKSAPSPPYTVTCGVIFNFAHVSSETDLAGLAFRQSSTGEIHALMFGRTTAGIGWKSMKFDSATVFNAYYTNGVQASMPNGIVFLRLVDDNTNRSVSWSLDGGREFVSVGTPVGRTDFLTADQWGLMLSPESNAKAVSMRVDSCKES